MINFLRHAKIVFLLALRRDFTPERIIIHDEPLISDRTDLSFSNGLAQVGCNDINFKPTQITFHGHLTISHHFFSRVGGPPTGGGPRLEIDNRELLLDTTSEPHGPDRTSYSFSTSLSVIDVARLNIEAGSRVCLLVTFHGQNARVKGTASPSVCLIDYEYEHMPREKKLAKRIFTIFTALTVLAFALTVPSYIGLIEEYLNNAYVFTMNLLF